MNAYDYEQLGAAFDQALPFMQPVTESLLAHLPPFPANARVLDVACGTGEPGLTLARRQPAVQVLGIDSSRVMIGVAQHKLAATPLPKLSFREMNAETLDLLSGSVDAVISRLGLLAVGDSQASARECARVLRSGGAFSLAVWNRASENTLVHAAFVALRERAPAELLPPIGGLDALAADGLREEWLRNAGFSTVQTELLRWDFAASSEAQMGDLIFGPGVFERPYNALGETERESVRQHFAEQLISYRRADGSYLIPHACRLFWGRR